MKLRTGLTAIAIAAAAATLALSQSAQADPVQFPINSYTSSTDGLRVEDFTIDNYVWGTTNFIDFVPNDGIPQTFHIEVNSGDSQRPGFDYDISFDYSAYDIGFFLNGSGPGFHELSLMNIKQPGDPNIITDVVAKDGNGNPIGIALTDGSSIFFSTTVESILATGEFITLQFSQAIPAPGALALLGLAGLAGARRRRA